MKRFLIVPYLGRMSFPDFNMGIFGILRPWAFNPRGSVCWYIFFLLMYLQTRCALFFISKTRKGIHFIVAASFAF